MGATLMDATGLHRTVIRLSHEIGERNKGFSDVVLIGVKKNGGIVARRIQNYIRDTEGFDLPCAEIDPNMQEIRLYFSIEGKTVVLCDDVLAPYFTKRTVIDNAVCQKGKGSHFALRRFENMLHGYIRTHGADGYILKCDILKYFPTIPHERLKKIFCAEIRDERIKQLLNMIIDSYHTDIVYLERYGVKPLADDSGKTGRGIPIGNQTSQLFGMYYLDPIDRLVKEKLRVKVYSRYMDDFVLVHEDLQYLRYVKSEIEKVADKLKLSLNSKTQIFPMKNGVTYLGFRFCVGPNGEIIKTVKKMTKRRFRWRARLLKKAYYDKIINGERVRMSLSAFHGHLKYSRSRKLEKELKDKLDFALNERN